MDNSTKTTSQIYPFRGEISLAQRNKLNRHGSGLIWLYGLSGSGKSTLAHNVEAYLHSKQIYCCVLDGDNVRTGLNKDLGLSPSDRKENIRRVAEVAKLMVNAGILVFAAFITPYEESRHYIRSLLADFVYHEIFIDAPLEVCAQRDPKGLYARSFAGEIDGFTGVSAPFEYPSKPDLLVDTSQLNLDESTKIIIDFLVDKGLLDGLSD